VVADNDDFWIVAQLVDAQQVARQHFEQRAETDAGFLSMRASAAERWADALSREYTLGLLLPAIKR